MPRFPFHIALIWSISMPDIGGTGCSLNIVLILRISSHDYIWLHMMPRFPYHIALIWNISIPDFGGTGCSLNIVYGIYQWLYMTTHDAQIPLPYRIDMEYIDSRFWRYRVFIKYCVWDISMPYRCVLNIVLILSISSNYLKTKKSVVMWSHVYSWCHQKKPFSLWLHMPTHDDTMSTHDYTWLHRYRVNQY